MSAKSRSTVYLFVTALIWGVAFVAQRVGADFVGPFTFNAARFALGGLSLVPVALFFEHGDEVRTRRRRTWLAGLLGGLVLFLASYLQQLGIALTGLAGKSAFITGLYIVLVPILGIFLGRKPRISVWLGAVLACGGLYLLSAPEGLGSVGWGDAVLLLGAFFWAVHIILVDRFARDVNPIRFSLLQFLICAALSGLCAFAFEEITLAGLTAAAGPILYAGLLSVGVAYTLQIFGQRHVEPGKAAIVFSLEAVFSALGAAILIGEFMTPRGYVGSLCILAGILLSQITPRREQ